MDLSSPECHNRYCRAVPVDADFAVGEGFWSCYLNLTGFTAECKTQLVHRNWSFNYLQLNLLGFISLLLVDLETW